MLEVFLFLCLYMLFRTVVSKSNLIFYNVFSISVFYFGVLSPVYWMSYSEGFFLGIDWSQHLRFVPGFFILVYIFVVILLKIKLDGRPYVKKEGSQFRLSSIEMALWGVFTISASYVVLASQQYLQGKEFGVAPPLYLIAYQLTDLAIPLCLLAVARSGMGLRAIFLVLLVSILYFYLGFRYKILLLIFPLFLFFINGNRNGFLAKSMAVFLALVLLALFSVMTSLRSKFSGFDLSKVEYFDWNVMLYGIFAESNIVFGLSSIVSNYYSTSSWIYFDPIFSTIIEYVPRFIYPEKSVYGYLDLMYIGLGDISTSQTGTAYPFVGEYYMMFGPAGVILGLIFYVYFYQFCKRKIVERSVSDSVILMGICLLSVFIGYYYFSRGFTPQISKGVAFILLPYILLCAKKRGG